jgi:hypothetical protein
MGSLAEYFAKNRYQAKYQIGDRVQGYWNKIPFRGTVGNDSCVDGVNPRVSVHLDLPLKFQNEIKYYLFVHPKDLKPLKAT